MPPGKTPFATQIIIIINLFHDKFVSESKIIDMFVL
jgi:hypothetical protein